MKPETAAWSGNLSVAAVLVASIVVTVIFWSVLPPGALEGQGGDYRSYYEPTARNLSSGSGYTTPGGNFVTRVPPGYPFILAAIFWIAANAHIPESLLLHGYILASIGLAASLLFIIARMLWGTLPALLSAVLWITCPFVLWTTVQYGSEIPFLPTLYACVALFLHGILTSKRSTMLFFMVGVIAGFTMLVRPIGFGVSPALALILLIWAPHAPLRRRLRQAGLLIAGSILVVLPWEIWVYAETNQVIFLSSADSASFKHGLIFGLPGERTSGHPGVDEDVVLLMQDISRRSGQSQSTKHLLSIIIGEFGHRPWSVIKLMVAKATRGWYGTHSGNHETYILWLQAFYLPLLLSATWRSLYSGLNGKVVALTLWLLAIYFWGMSMLVTPLLRYIVPAEALLFALVPALLIKTKGFGLLSTGGSSEVK